MREKQPEAALAFIIERIKYIADSDILSSEEFFLMGMVSARSYGIQMYYYGQRTAPITKLPNGIHVYHMLTGKRKVSIEIVLFHNGLCASRHQITFSNRKNFQLKGEAIDAMPLLRQARIKHPPTQN